MVWAPPQGLPRADPLTLRERAAPAAMVDAGKVYVKDVAGRSELFYRDDTGAEMQVTSGGAMVGSMVDTLAATLAAGNAAGGTALLAAPGTEALPGLAHDGDAGTGRRRVSAGVLGWSLSSVERMRLVGQCLVLGGTTPQTTTLPALEIQSGVQAFIFATVAGSAGPHIDFYRARGNLQAPTNVADGDVLGIHEFVGHNGVYQTAASVISYVEGALGSAIPSRLEFNTSSSGTPSLLALRLNASQQALHASGTAALPSVAFVSEPGLGLFRVGAGAAALVATGSLKRFEYSTIGIGFFATPPVTRRAALTQIYATADRTLDAYTPDSEASAYTGATDGEAKLADLNALRVAYENLRAFTEDAVAFLNANVDDQQAYGLVEP